MCEGEASVKAGGVGASSELVEGHELILAQVVGDSFGDNLLNEFAEAFNELGGAVRLGEGHVLLVVLWDDSDNQLLP